MRQKNLSTSGIKTIIKIICVFVALIIFLAAAQRLLMPKYRGKLTGTTVVSEYYDDEKNNEVIFIGDSEIYYNFAPSVLNENYDINAVVEGLFTYLFTLASFRKIKLLNLGRAFGLAC